MRRQWHKKQDPLLGQSVPVGFRVAYTGTDFVIRSPGNFPTAYDAVKAEIHRTDANLQQNIFLMHGDKAARQRVALKKLKALAASLLIKDKP